MTTVMSELAPKNSAFSDYYNELTDALARAQTSIQAAESDTISSSGDDHVSTAQRHVEEAGDLLNSLEMELQTLGAKTRSVLRPYVSAVRDQLSRHRSSVRALQIRADGADEQNARVRLLSGHENDFGNNDGLQDLEAASKSISDSRRNVMETEAVGASILSDLQAQRATMVRAQNNLGVVDDGIDTSSSILSSMHRRAILNKIIIYIVGAAIAIACVAVLYVRLFHPNAKTIQPTQPTQS